MIKNEISENLNSIIVGLHNTQIKQDLALCLSTKWRITENSTLLTFSDCVDVNLKIEISEEFMIFMISYEFKIIQNI